LLHSSRQSVGDVEACPFPQNYLFP